MSYILRYYISHKDSEERLKEIINCCSRIGCKELLLFTSSYDLQPSFIPLKEIEEYVEKLKIWKEELGSHGIKMYLNVMQTLGHIYYPKLLSGEFNFQRKVNSLGEESKGGACPLDKELQEYIAAVYKLYARVKPDLIFVDDDYRNTIGGFNCFCPLHMSRFSEKLEYGISREKLVSKLLENNGIHENVIRKEFHELQVQGMNEMALIIQKAVHEVSPESQVGLMTEAVPFGFWGTDFRTVAKTFCGDEGIPFIRPQIATYWEESDMHSFAGAYYQPSIVRNLCGNDIKLYPEVENYPYSAYSKSAQVTMLFMSSIYLQGCNNPAVNFFDTFNSPLSEYEDLIEMLEERKEYFNALTVAIPEGTKSQGISLWQHPKGFLYNRIKLGGHEIKNLMPKRSMDGYVPLLGLPVGFDWGESPFLFLCGDDILALSREEQDKMLKRGAVMDRKAYECLLASGWGERIGITFGDEVTADDSGCEKYEDNIFCEEHAGRYSPLHMWAKDGWCRKMKCSEQLSYKVLSNLINYKGEVITPLVTAIENNMGERFGVLAFDADDMQRISFVNARRSVQMRNLFEWVARKELPVTIISGAFIVPFYVPADEKTSIVALSNFSSETVTSLKLKISHRNPKAIEYLTPEGKWISVHRDFEEEKPGLFRVDCSIAPNDLNIYTLKFDDAMCCEV